MTSLGPEIVSDNMVLRLPQVTHNEANDFLVSQDDKGNFIGITVLY